MAPLPSDRSQPLQDLETDAALRAILEGTATETGQQFFAALVQNLAKALGTHGAWVTEYFPEKRRLRALAFWMDGQWVHDYEVDIAGTACEQVIDQVKLVHFPDRILELFPHNEELKAAGAVSYMGVPLQDTDGHILGHIAVIDRRPIPEEPQGLCDLSDLCRAGRGGTPTAAGGSRGARAGRKSRAAPQQRDGRDHRAGRSVPHHPRESRHGESVPLSSGQDGRPGFPAIREPEGCRAAPEP